MLQCLVVHKIFHELTPAERAKGLRKTNQRRRLTRSWFMGALIDIFEGKIKCNGPQLNALKTFADVKGWHGPKNKRSAVAGGVRNAAGEIVDSRPKPKVSEDVLKRMIAALPQEKSQSPDSKIGSA